MKHSAYVRGGLYSVVSKAGYNVTKILAIAEGIIHIRLYKNEFAQRPHAMELDTSELALGTIHDPDGFGMGHLPLSVEAFQAWEPLFIAQAEVSEEELEGYNLWKECEGGVWE